MNTLNSWSSLFNRLIFLKTIFREEENFETRPSLLELLEDQL